MDILVPKTGGRQPDIESGPTVVGGAGKGQDAARPPSVAILALVGTGRDQESLTRLGSRQIEGEATPHPVTVAPAEDDTVSPYWRWIWRLVTLMDTSPA